MIDVDDIKATWEARPRGDHSALLAGPGLILMSAADSRFTLMLAPPAETPMSTDKGRIYRFHAVCDEAYDTSGRTAFLLHRRVRIMCEGVVLEEQIEPTSDALKRGRYHQVGKDDL